MKWEAKRVYALPSPAHLLGEHSAAYREHFAAQEQLLLLFTLSLLSTLPLSHTCPWLSSAYHITPQKNFLGSLLLTLQFPVAVLSLHRDPLDMSFAPMIVATSFSLGGRQLGRTQEGAANSEGATTVSYSYLGPTVRETRSRG